MRVDEHPELAELASQGADDEILASPDELFDDDLVSEETAAVMYFKINNVIVSETKSTWTGYKEFLIGENPGNHSKFVTDDHKNYKYGLQSVTIRQ